MHIRLYVLQHKITLRNFNGMYNYKKIIALKLKIVIIYICARKCCELKLN